MTLKEFIKTFSHNNEVFIENKNNYCMQYAYHHGEKKRDLIMDWEVGNYTDIRDCEVICIKNVIHPHSEHAITIKINTNLTEFEFVPETVKLDNAPLWLYNEIHETNIQGVEC